MRIIAGKHRGRKLIAPKDEKVRPTSDRIRESIFNILQWNIIDKVVLDLFAGTGAMGLEAISRGAKAVFNDNDRESIALIKHNLKALNEQAEIFNLDYADAIERLKGRKFDIIFLDPPYKKDIKHVLTLIKCADLLMDNGIIVYERSSDIECVYDKYIIKDQRKYGKTALDFLEIVK